MNNGIYIPRPKPFRGKNGLIWMILAGLVYCYILACWLVRPLNLGANISLAYVVPLSFVIGLLLMRTPRGEFLDAIGKFRIELGLTLFMSFMCLLSLLNSSEPFRAFRILFPCILPTLLFFQLVALRTISPETIEKIPRFFLFAGLFFSVLPLLLSFVSGGLYGYLFKTHRLIGTFENPNQHSVALAALIPLAIMEIANSGRRLTRLLWFVALFALLYTLVRTGSKTALILSISAGWLYYILAHVRSYTALQNVLLIGGMIALMLGVGLFGIQIASTIDPVLGKKLEMIFSDGVNNYYSIQSRQKLWEEAYAQGTRHWLIGAGAGEVILGVSHAHNLPLEYFRGIGLFGAIAIVVLCLRILWRTSEKSLRLLSSKSISRREMRIWGCYVSAAVYTVCNQLSDSFGPTTIGALWLIYLPAVLMERPSRRAVKSPAVRRVHQPLPQPAS